MDVVHGGEGWRGGEGGDCLGGEEGGWLEGVLVGRGGGGIDGRGGAKMHVANILLILKTVFSWLHL